MAVKYKASPQELKAAFEEAEQKNVKDVIEALQGDPNASLHILSYTKTEGYLNELIEKDGSLMKGIVSALECYLEK